MCNVIFDNISRTPLALPAETGGLGVSSASLLALPAFLASAFGASDFRTTIFSETFEDLSFTKALEKWLSLTNEQESPLEGTRRLNVVPCKNLDQKLDDQQLRISIALRLGANICVAHTCHCGKRVERDGLHGLSGTKSAGRFSRHTTLWYMPYLPNPILPNPTLPKAWDFLPNFFSAKWASKFGKVGKAVVYICKNRLLKL